MAGCSRLLGNLGLQEVIKYSGTKVCHAGWYHTSDNTALADADYTATTGDYTFGPNDFSYSFTIPITNNSFVGLESRYFDLLVDTIDASGNIVSGYSGSGTETIIEDDVRPSSISILPLEVYDANGNVIPGVTEIPRDGYRHYDIILDYVGTHVVDDIQDSITTINGTATAGEDFRPVTVPVTIHPNAQSGDLLGSFDVAGAAGTTGSDGIENFTFMNSAIDAILSNADLEEFISGVPEPTTPPEDPDQPPPDDDTTLSGGDGTAGGAPPPPVVSAVVGVNLIKNGSFETPVLNDSDSTLKWKDVPDSPDTRIGVPGWTSANGYFEIQTNKLWDSVGFYPKDGRQMVELDGDLTNDTHTSTTIYQYVTGLVVGGTYEFSYYAGGRPGTSSNENIIRAVVQESSTGNVIYDSTTPGITPNAWLPVKKVFTVNDTDVTISLIDGGVQDNKVGSLVDNVQLVLTKPPGSYITDYRSATSNTNIPTESNFGFSVRDGEHMDNMSTFTFNVQGTMRNVATVKKSLFLVTDSNGSSTSTRFLNWSSSQVTGSTVDNSYSLDFSNVAEGLHPTQATKFFVEYFNDKNHNNTIDAGEEDVKSPTFIVMPFATKTIKVLYSDLLANPNNTAAVSRLRNDVKDIFLLSSQMLQRRDSADDFRAIVNIVLDPSVHINGNPATYDGFRAATHWDGVTGAHPADPYMIDPAKTQTDVKDDITNGWKSGYNLTFLKQLPVDNYGYTDKNTVTSFYHSVVDFSKRRPATTIHELGHNFGLLHPGHKSSDIMFTPPENNSGDPRKELEPEDVKAFDGI